MALTKISGNEIQPASITADLISANVSFGVKISNVSISNSTYSILDDTAVNVGGGYIVVTGSDFQSGAVVLVDTTQATSTTYVNSTTLRVQIPAKSAATYNIYVVNPDGGVGIKINGITYSATPTWVTSSPLANVQANQAFTGSFSATGATSYSVADGSSLPSGMTLVGANGYYYGTITVGSDTTYSFTINATDAENQDSPATFNLTAIATILDNYFNSTVLLLQGDGTNGAQNKTILDSSTNATAITRYGNVTQGSLSPFSPTGWSAYFDGSNDYVDVSEAGNTLLSINSDFTIEFWVYFNAVGSRQDILSGGGGAYVFALDSDNYIKWYSTSSWIVSSTTTIAAGQWYHVALARQSGTVRLFINGSLESSASASTNYSGYYYIGRNVQVTSYYLSGYLSNFRVVRDSVVYTTTFTPSASPLAVHSSGNTKLLTFQNNRFKDNSADNMKVTPVDGSQIVPFSPFAPTEAYNPTTHGGSIYLDDSGDFMTVESGTPINFGTNSFTIEWWVQRVTAYTTDRDELPMGGDTTSSFMLGMQNGQLQFGITNTSWNIESSITIPLGVWAHCAIVRNGTTVTMYINGVSAGSATMSTNFTGASYFQIGRRGASTVTNKSINYLSGLRIVNGTAVYTSAFTPPTSAPTAITNTSLLVNGTNANIYDATAKNVLETVGDAQVSTSVKKYGTGSMYFDGTGDSIYTDKNYITLGSGDFTIEGWFYHANSSDKYVFMVGSDWNTSGSLCLLIFSGNYALSVGTSYSSNIGTSVTANQWIHIAVVRSGSTNKLYVNGVAAPTSVNSTENINSNIIRIGGQGTGAAWSAYSGYIDDLRITKGVARYTSNFTPPTAALPVQ